MTTAGAGQQAKTLAALCLLFVLAGHGVAEIGDRRFAITPSCGVFVRPGETFRIEPGGHAIELLMTVCPAATEEGWTDAMKRRQEGRRHGGMQGRHNTQ